MEDLARRLHDLTGGERGGMALSKKSLLQQWEEGEANVRARMGIAPDDPEAEMKMVMQMALAEAEVESGLPPGSLGNPTAQGGEASAAASGLDPFLSGADRTAVDDLRDLERDLAAAAAAGGDADEIQKLLAEASSPFATCTPHPYYFQNILLGNCLIQPPWLSCRSFFES